MASEAILITGIDARRMTSGAKQTTDALKTIENRVETTGGRLDKFRERVRRPLTTGPIGRAAGRASGLLGSLGALTKGFAGLAAAVGLIKFGSFVAQTAELNNRLLAVVGSQEAASVQLEELRRVSNETRTDLGGNVEAFQQYETALRGTGTSTEELTEFIRVLNLGFKASGTDIETASGTLRQLGQGLSAGALRGDELNSFLEGAPGLVQPLIDSLNRLAEANDTQSGMALATQLAGGEVTRGNLRDIAAEGLISREAILGIVDSADELEEAFARQNVTIGDAFGVLTNNVAALLTDSRAVQGTIQLIANTILLVADGVQLLAEGLDTVADLYDRIVASAKELVDALPSISVPDIDLPSLPSISDVTDLITRNEGDSGIGADIEQGGSTAAQEMGNSIREAGEESAGFFSRAISNAGSALGLSDNGSENFNTGGPVTGRGGIDNVPALLTAGEFVVNRRAASRNRSLLGAINSGRISRFQEGGPVGPAPSPGPGPGVGGGGAITGTVDIAGRSIASIGSSVEQGVSTLAPEVEQVITPVGTGVEDAADTINTGVEQSDRSADLRQREAFSEGRKRAQEAQAIANRLAIAQDNASLELTSFTTAASRRDNLIASLLENSVTLEAADRNAEGITNGLVLNAKTIASGEQAATTAQVKAIASNAEGIIQAVSATGSAITRAIAAAATGDEAGIRRAASGNIEGIDQILASTRGQVAGTIAEIGLQLMGVFSTLRAQASQIASSQADAISRVSNLRSQIERNVTVSLAAFGGVTAPGGNSRARPSPRARFQFGGLVGGVPGVDRNLARLSRGEFVVNREDTRQNLDLLEDINSGRGGSRTSRSVTYNITTPDVSGFRRSRNQILSRERQALARVE